MNKSFQSREPIAVKITDADLNDLYCNRGLARLAGYSPAELDHRGWITIFDPGMRATLASIAGRAGEKPDETRTGFAPIDCADGSQRLLHWEIASIPSASDPLLLIVARPADLEAETGAGSPGDKAALRQSMESLSRLANAIAHDYNNLLSGIVGYAGMLEMLPDLPEKATRYIGELHKATYRLNEMTQRLLLFGRKRTPHVQPVDLNRIAAQALESPDVLQPGQEVSLETRDEPIVVPVDPMQMQVLLHNLLQNALEAVEDGGKVTLRTACRRADEAFQTVFATAPAGNYAVLEVQDTGRGIEPQRLAQVFEPYTETDFRKLGRGLGLSIVFRIVHNHGGFLLAESTPGAGTCFTVLFPMEA